MSSVFSLERYAVQPIIDGQPVAVSECIQVDAAGPVQAAELALGSPPCPARGGVYGKGYRLEHRGQFHAGQLHCVFAAQLIRGDGK